MARDWESWLKTASGPASATEEAERDRTEREVRAAVRAAEDLPASVRVYAKGSYANGTNVRRNADVDIAVEWTDTRVVDTWGPTARLTPEQLGYTPASESMTPTVFRGRVEAALTAHFGARRVDTTQDKHIDLSETGSTLEADVVPCFALSRYDAPRMDFEGIRIYPRSGGFVDNFPQQNIDNSNSKNLRTGRRYKQIVRCVKRIALELAETGQIDDNYPGYLVESLVYNAPDACFGHDSRFDDIGFVIKRLWGGLRDGEHETWTEPNQLLHLFKGRQDRSTDKAFAVVDAAWDALGL